MAKLLQNNGEVGVKDMDKIFILGLFQILLMC